MGIGRFLRLELADRVGLPIVERAWESALFACALGMIPSAQQINAGGPRPPRGVVSLGLSGTTGSRRKLDSWNLRQAGMASASEVLAATEYSGKRSNRGFNKQKDGDGDPVPCLSTQFNSPELASWRVQGQCQKVLCLEAAQIGRSVLVNIWSIWMVTDSMHSGGKARVEVVELLPIAGVQRAFPT